MILLYKLNFNDKTSSSQHILCAFAQFYSSYIMIHYYSRENRKPIVFWWYQGNSASLRSTEEVLRIHVAVSFTPILHRVDTFQPLRISTCSAKSFSKVTGPRDHSFRSLEIQAVPILLGCKSLETDTQSLDFRLKSRANDSDCFMHRVDLDRSLWDSLTRRHATSLEASIP